MKKKLNTKEQKVFIADGFDRDEFDQSVKALKKATISMNTLSLKTGEESKWKEKKWGEEFNTDRSADNVKIDNYNAFLLSQFLHADRNW